MHKKTLISFKIPTGSLPTVTKGKKIAVGDQLTKTPQSEIDEFDLVKILKILPKNLHHYLKVKENSPVVRGDIVAGKKNLFKKEIIKAPSTGIFVIVDKNKGIVGIKREHKTEELVSWFDGEVAEVDETSFSVYVIGTKISGKSGQGKPISGKLHVVTKNIQAFSLPLNIEQKILALKLASSDLVAKADALGAAAIITEHIEEPSFALPYLIIDDIRVLENHNDRSVIIHGDEKYLLIT